MLGLLVIIVISWGLLYLIEKEHIDALGIIPSPRSLAQFSLGFIIIIALVLINIYLETEIRQVQWESKTFEYKTLWNAFIYHIRSALTEDLVFRGALLYILIKRIGSSKAILISAICFGVYHWFSFGILQQRWILLVFIFTISGFTGYVWAYSFHKTRSIMLGLGLHLGFNLTMSCFFPNEPYGEILYSSISKTNLSGWSEFTFSLFKGIFPSLSTFLILYFYFKRNENLTLKAENDVFIKKPQDK